MTLLFDSATPIYGITSAYILVDTLQIWYVGALGVRGGRAMIDSIHLSRNPRSEGLRLTSQHKVKYQQTTVKNVMSKERID